MATEEQTAYNATFNLYSGAAIRVAQRLTIPYRTVSKLSFVLDKVGAPTGNITFTIRKVSDDSVISSKVWGDASGLSTSAVWQEVTFDAPQDINEEVRICTEFATGDVDNRIRLWLQQPSIKADEYAEYYYSGGPWTSATSYDCAYIYTYTLGGIPKVTTQAVTDIAPEALTGNGTITDKGDAAVTQHGHCWDTSANPTVALLTKTQNGAAPNLGQFSSSITGLTPGILYYIRAYATNSYGTGYGADVTNTQGTALGRRYLWIEGKCLHYFDEYGIERILEGTTVAAGYADLPWYFFT
uniref:Fibronectin type-III domain-containing protein n=1 Tax=viral metagenome TaxID=1070528 RepID=A0A6H2A0N0_9ZZZZ